MFKDETKKNQLISSKICQRLKKIAIKKMSIKFDRKRKTKRGPNLIYEKIK